MSKEEKVPTLGEIEELVILAILKLDQYAYGVAIQDLLEKATKRTVNVRGLYTTLQRLEGKGLIRTVSGGEQASGGGRPRKYYAVKALGIQALKRSIKQRETWDRHRKAVSDSPVPV
jgi:PadR family transcriptional regulator, regulatory protein PadR